MRFPQAHPPSDRGVILTTMTILGNRAARRHRRTRCAGVGCERWAGPTLAALDAQMARLQAQMCIRDKALTIRAFLGALTRAPRRPT